MEPEPIRKMYRLSPVELAIDWYIWVEGDIPVPEAADVMVWRQDVSWVSLCGLCDRCIGRAVPSFPV